MDILDSKWFSLYIYAKLLDDNVIAELPARSSGFFDMTRHPASNNTGQSIRRSIDYPFVGDERKLTGVTWAEVVATGSVHQSPHSR